MEKERQLIWENQAVTKLAESIAWIAETSEYQAEQVERAILERIEIIRNHPERYPLDKYRANNTGNCRACETHSYRIAYSYTKDRVTILRIRHVKQEPKNH